MMLATLLRPSDRCPEQDEVLYSRGEIKREESGGEGGTGGISSVVRLDSVQCLDENIAEARETIRDWQSQCDEHRAVVEDLRKNISSKEYEIWEMEHEKEALLSKRVEKPPGPASLRWVDSTNFNLFSALVVLMNIGVMFRSVANERDKDEAQSIWWINQAFLIFYITELVLRWLLFQREFLLGPCSTVWWNWLDLIIVIGGILDEWFLPIVYLFSNASVQNSALSVVFKGVRVLRIARILKVVRTLLTSDLSWAEGDKFQVFMMGVIGLNCIVMGVETDYELEGIEVVDNLFLIIYVFELVVRLRNAGPRFFNGPCADVAWNVLDFVIVVGGVIDQWLVPGLELARSLLSGATAGKQAPFGNESVQIMMLLRMARLLRLLRLLRLIKNIDALYKLVVGIVDAMQGMLWVLVLTFVLLYCFGLFCVKLFGQRHGMAWGGKENVPVAIQNDDAFQDLPSAMWVLFMCMNGDAGDLESLFEVLAWTKLLCAIFMVISSWAILSILTAVVSDNMMKATDKTEAESEIELKKRDERERYEKLHETFELFDKKEPKGRLTQSEFEQAMSHPDHRKSILESSSLTEEQVAEIFLLLLKLKGDNDGAISQDDFIEGMQCQDTTPTRKEILQLQAKQLEFLELIRGEQGIAYSVERTMANKLTALEHAICKRLSSDTGMIDAISQVSELTEKVKILTGQHAERLDRVEELTSKLRERRDQVTDLTEVKERDADEQNAAQEALQKELEMTKSKADIQADALTKKVEDLEARHQEKVQRLEALATELRASSTKAENRARSLEQQAEQGAAKLDSLRKQLEGERDATKVEAERLSKVLDELTAKSTKDAGRIQDLSKELRERAEQVQELQKVVEQESAKTLATQETLQKEVYRVKEEAKDEVEELRAALAASERACAAALDRAEVAEAQLCSMEEAGTKVKQGFAFDTSSNASMTKVATQQPPQGQQSQQSQQLRTPAVRQVSVPSVPSMPRHQPTTPPLVRRPVHQQIAGARSPHQARVQQTEHQSPHIRVASAAQPTERGGQTRRQPQSA